MEQSDEVDEEKLQKIASIIGFSVDTIRNYSDEQTVNYIQNNYEGSKSNYSGVHNCSIYDDKVMDLVAQNKVLYEQLLKVEREKNALLENMLRGKI